MPEDVEIAKGRFAGAEPKDIFLAGKSSITNQQVKTGEPVLLIRVLEANGLKEFEGLTHAAKQKLKVLSLETHSTSPDYKVLLYAFRAGDPLPATKWSGKNAIIVSFPKQEDRVSFNRN